MTKKARYLLIFSGLVFFIFFAPVMAFFVSGIKFDFKSKKLISTGILAIKTEPKDAEIFLNNKLVKSVSSQIRFLTPQNYLITLKKNGYFEWNKTLPIESNKVTWTEPQNGKIQMLKKDNAPEILFKACKDFIFRGPKLAALCEGNFVFLDINNIAQAKSSFVGTEVSEIIAADNFNNFILTSSFTAAKSKKIMQALYYDAQNNKTIDISSLINPVLKDAPLFNFGENEQLLGLFEDNLYKITPNNISKKIIANKVLGYTTFGDTIYVIQQNSSTTTSLNTLNINSNEAQTIKDNLPLFTTAALTLNSQKRIFINADGNLYDASQNGLNLLAKNAKNVLLSKSRNELAFASGGEFWYTSLNGQTKLITRISTTPILPQAIPEIGYALYIDNGLLMALEIDPRGGPNQYILYNGNAKKYALDSDNRSIILLDNEELKRIRLR